MADQRPKPSSTAASPTKAITPPKGRPTHSRHDLPRRRKVFGATAQWIAVAVVIALAFIALFVATDGGDFNPFNDSAPLNQPAPSTPAQ